MGQIGIWQIAIVAIVVVLLFGRGKISAVMGDVAKGINSFKKGLKDEDETKTVVIEEGGDTVVEHHTTERSKTS